MNLIINFFHEISLWLQSLFSNEFSSIIVQLFSEILSWLSSYSTAVAGWLWVVMLFIGFTLLFAVYYFRRQSKQLNHALVKLFYINDLYKQDALEFFEQAWPVLKSIGCVNLMARIEWFGENKDILKGNFSTKAETKDYLVQQDDMRFEILVGFSRDSFQKESIAAIVVQTFIHIIEQDLVLKKSEILTSQKRLERYQLFVQHEIKNISQFIQVLSEQVQQLETTEAKEKLVNRLSSSLPVMAQRARKTVDHMQQPLAEFYRGELFELEDLLQNIADMYGLSVRIKGSASISLSQEVLSEIFKNILGNYRDHDIGMQKIFIDVNNDLLSNKVNISISCRKNAGLDFRSERMFEPFWTTSESGMGLGLFLARELLKQIDGKIEFFQIEEKELFGFQIYLSKS